MMSDEWFERQYTPSYWSNKHTTREDTIQHFLKFMCDHSEEARKQIKCELNTSYGHTDNQKIDYFYPDGDKSNKLPLLVFIHGGYWQEGDRTIYSAVSRAFTQKDFTVAVVGYDLAPSVRIQDIIKQVIKAIESIKLKFSRPLVLIGHSAGAYLAVAVSKQIIVNGLVLISGVYDLHPLLKTSINKALKMTVEDANQLNLSNINQLSVDHILICVGGDESTEFKLQSSCLYEMLKGLHPASSLLVVENEDHFSIIENLASSTFLLTKRICQLATNIKQ